MRRPKGTGTIRERRPGVWEVRAPRPDQPPKSRTVRGTREDAEKALRKLLSEVDSGSHRGKRRNVSELLDKWFALRSPDLSPTTVHTYRGYIDKHIRPAIGSKPLDKLGTDDLDELYMDLRARLSPSSIHQCHAIIHGALRQARRWGWIVANPADETTRPQRRSPEVVPPAPAEVVSVIRAVEAANPEYATFLFLKAGSGCRRGELCALRWHRVDWDEGAIAVVRNLIELLDTGGTMEKDTKGHTERVVPLDPFTLEALRRHRTAMEKRAADCGATLRPDGYVFSTVADGSAPWHPRYPTRQFKALKDKLGLEYRQHDIRHMYATVLMPHIDPRNLAEILGWTNPAMLYKVYGHPTKEQAKRAAAIMGELLNPDAKTPPPPAAEPGTAAEG